MLESLSDRTVNANEPGTQRNGQQEAVRTSANHKYQLAPRRSSAWALQDHDDQGPVWQCLCKFPLPNGWVLSMTASCCSGEANVGATRESAGTWQLPSAPQYLSQFRIGGVSVELSGRNAADVALGPQLEPFRANLQSDVQIEVERVAHLAAGTGRIVFDSGSTWRLYGLDSGLQFDFLAAVFGDQPIKRLLVDSQFRRAKLLLNEECSATLGHPVEPLAYPLDELLIMHRLTQEHAIELHGCGIVRAYGKGILFVGHSGAGKSTTTRLWTERESVEVLSDDRIILRPEGSDVPPSKNRVGGIRMYGTPWHGEAMYASPGSGALQAIFILEHGAGNKLTELAPCEAVAELFARSFVPFHRHEYVAAALDFLQKVAAAVPCYRYAFEPNQSAVDAVRKLHD